MNLKIKIRVSATLIWLPPPSSALPHIGAQAVPYLSAPLILATVLSRIYTSRHGHGHGFPEQSDRAMKK
uniref:Secreted protein n=1 Tax=Romanomermis culicivorax TaxID=13658 RepID=A0A915L5Q4_ROMCU